MARVGSALRKLDLKQLEALLAKRRKQETKSLKGLVSKRKKLESELARVKRALGSSRGVKGAITRKPNARRLNKISLGDAIEKVMSSRSKPIHYKDLTDIISRRGLYKTKSKNLLSTVAVTLKRDRRFKKIEPGIYGLRKK